MKIFLTSVVALILGQCHQSKELTSGKIEKQDDLSKVEIVYQTTPCFGKCPVYSLTIHGSNKTMTFSGSKNTDKVGEFTKPVTEEQLKDLIKAFEAADFCNLEEKYLGQVVDFPSQYTSYTCNGKTKKVQDRSGAPEKLHQLEAKLKEIAESKDGWAEIGDTTH